MFYSEKLQSPVSSCNVKRLYGVNPESEPAKAALIGVFPLAEAPAGYTASHFVKDGNHYQAVPLPVSNEELGMVDVIRRENVSMQELQLAVIPEWQPDITYTAGDHVKHEGEVYSKDDDGDNSEPDAVPGGWTVVR